MAKSAASSPLLFLLVLCLLTTASDAFTTPSPLTVRRTRSAALRMSDPNPPSAPTGAGAQSQVEDDTTDPMQQAEEELDADTLKLLAKQRRAQELREQEVFMKKSTGVFKCSNCDWEFDETKGDSNMIGGMVKPGTKFEDLASNWRCPVCRASKDSFVEVVEEIPGFEVNQGYGFGTNSWSAGQKNLAIFGGLGIFFVLFLSGYAMS